MLFSKSIEEPVNGVKRSNPFIDLKYFNVIDGCPPDIMHDFLEGVLVVNFTSMINYLLNNNILKYEEIVKKIETFNYARLDSKNKIPKNIFSNGPNGFKISLTATHCWTLIRIFPLIYGHVLKNDNNYKNFLKLIEIFFLLNDSIYQRFLRKKRKKRIEKEFETDFGLEMIFLAYAIIIIRS